MACGQLPGILQYLRRLAPPAASPGVSDAELLARFLRQRDDAAFELLVWRHGKMVLSTCRRVVRDAEDAEDAFQASFLALARRAGSIGRLESVGAWLHKVAYRMALSVREQTARRCVREQPLDERLAVRSTDPAAAATWREVRLLLDEEVNRLGDKYRVPFVLCCLEGKSNVEAARDLGCPVGTLESRLTRARQRLRARLARRGLLWSAGLLTAGLHHESTAAALSQVFLRSTVQAAVRFAARAPAAGPISGPVAAMTEGVLHAMFLNRVKLTATFVLAVVLMTAAVGVLARPAWAAWLPQNPPAPAAAPQPAVAPAVPADKLVTEQAVVRKVDPERRSLTVVPPLDGGTPAWIQLFQGQQPYILGGSTFLPGQQPHMVGGSTSTQLLTNFVWGATNAAPSETTYRTSRGIKVVIDGVEAKLADLTPDTTIQLTRANGVVTRIEATGTTMDGAAEKIEIIQNTITIRHYDHAYQYGMMKDVPVFIDGQESDLKDLKADMPVVLRFSAVKQQTVIGIQAVGPLVECSLKSIDVRRHTIAIRLAKQHLTVPDLAVAPEARVQIQGKAGRLADLQAGMRLSLRMSADPENSLVLGIQAERVK